MGVGVMKFSFARVGLFLAVFVAPAIGQTAELRPVGSTGPSVINGNEIQIPTGGAGVEVELHILMYGWDSVVPNTFLGTAGAKIDGDNGFSSGSGTPLLPIEFGTSTESHGGYIASQVCFFSGRPGCPSPGTPASGETPCVAIDPADGPCVPNPAFVLYANSPITAVNFNIGLSYEFVAVRSSPQGALDEGTNHYLGTLILDIPEGAAGTYTIGFVEDPLSTYMADDDVKDIPIQTFIPATIVVGGGSDCSAVISSDPPNCAIDARQPHPSNNQVALQGWNSIQFDFNAECDVSTLSAGDFSITSGLAISSVGGAGAVATVNFSSIIPTNDWTCVGFTSSGDEFCLGFLPGDVNGSRMSNAYDVIALIDDLNDVSPLPDYATDINRSGAADASDVSTLVSLLDGVGAFDPWLGEKISLPCPSAP
ncbi:MAG: hypothetical protein J5J06_15150 [Phycisphaerae bacterium]|nr:hypothetical protein [Phycisphaerae bacterium]